MSKLLHSMAIGFASVMLWVAPGRAADIEPPGDVRTELTAEALLSGVGLPGRMIHNDWFMPVGEAGPALHAFSGTLVIPETAMQGFDGVPWEDVWYPDGYHDNIFPAVDVSFISHDGHLIPMDADIIAGTGATSPWNIIVSPGRVWSEPADGGLSRASFPFVLADSWNQAHNGLMTFVYDDDAISKAQFQIVQQTAPDNRFSAFGELDAAYRAHVVDGDRSVIDGFERDRATRLPVKAFADLETGLSIRALLAFGEPNNLPMSASGVIVDDTIYLRPCKTLYGDFPYCDEMRHGVYSVSKSLGAMVSMLYLAEKYGDGVFDLKVKDYVDVTAGHDGWENVTFADALNMATGMGEVATEPLKWLVHAIGQDSELAAAFYLAASASDRLRTAFAVPSYTWGPGELFRYNNMDTFILAAAMDGLVKEREGPDANLWDMVTAEVLRPIGIFTLPLTHTDESDGSRGVPLLRSGAYPNVQDVARIVGLLRSGGRFGEQQLLSEAMLDEAFYRTDVRGLDARSGGTSSYHMSLWYIPVRLMDCQFDAPFMSGYGGNLIVMLPNDVTVFHFTDNALVRVHHLIEAAHEIRSVCPS